MGTFSNCSHDKNIKSMQLFLLILYIVFLFSQSLTDTLIKICELLTSDPPGANARIPFDQWKKFYRYLAELDGEIRQEQIQEVIDYLANEWVIRQNGMIHPRNFIHPECPKLEALLFAYYTISQIETQYIRTCLHVVRLVCAIIIFSSQNL